MVWAFRAWSFRRHWHRSQKKITCETLGCQWSAVLLTKEIPWSRWSFSNVLLQSIGIASWSSKLRKYLKFTFAITYEALGLSTWFLKRFTNWKFIVTIEDRRIFVVIVVSWFVSCPRVYWSLICQGKGVRSRQMTERRMLKDESDCLNREWGPAVPVRVGAHPGFEDIAQDLTLHCKQTLWNDSY